jgi:peptide chain release factor 1
VPPTERKGRVHTSTVTVSVVEPQTAKTIEFNERDFSIEWYSGTGCGGQARNKNQTSARITHIPTGTIATAQTRSRVNSFEEAKSSILRKLNSYLIDEQRIHESDVRKNQTGSGMRGDKRRTYRFQEDQVKDHITGKSASISKVMAGNFDLLW